MPGRNKSITIAQTHVVSHRLPTTSITLYDFFAKCNIEKPKKSTKKQTEKRKGINNGVSLEPAVVLTNGNACAEVPKITILRRPSREALPRRCDVKSCPRIHTTRPKVPPELQHVDKMTSAEFRSDYGAHLETMRTRQKDQQHMRFFEALIDDNRHLFVGRSILVLSCGTGTLALMAARAGAARVYALDHSNVTDYARLVVKENHLEHIIKVLHGRVEDVELQREQVDGIICNWMGYSLLYESELLQLLAARDRWLKPHGGFIMPDLAALYMLGASETELKNARCNWWLGVYGFNMNAMRRYALAEPRYARVKGDRLLTKAHQVKFLDLHTASVRDLEIDRSIQLQVLQEGCFECFVLYFDVQFSRAHEQFRLSCNPCLTGQLQLKSLWLQTILFLDQPFVMRRDKCYTGHLRFKSLAEYPQLDMQRMRIDIEFFETLRDTLHPLVHKSWLMLPHFQSTQEVASCQDRLIPHCL